MLNGTKSCVPIKFTPSIVPKLPLSNHASAVANATFIFCQDSPVLYQKDFVVTSYTINPVVCGILILCAVVILGINNPLLEDLISTIAFGFAFVPSVLIATF